MKVVVLYRPNSEHARLVEEFIRDMEHQYHVGTVETVNIDSRDGWATASLYDVVEYPSILALTNDGQMLKLWQGDQLPRLQEVAYYTHD